MCQSLGWDWDTARRQLDIPRLNALNAYWDDTPPLQVSVAAIARYLGVRFQTQPKAPPHIAAAPGGEAGEVLDMLIGH